MRPSACLTTSRLSSNELSIDEAFADVAGCTHLFGAPSEIAGAVRRRVRVEVGLPISIGVARTKHLAKIASQVAKPDGLMVVDPESELNFLHDLPVELMWGVGPATKARLAEMGVHTIGQLAKMPGWSLERVVGRAVGEKLAALAWNRDPREIRTHRRAQSAGAQSALGRKPAEEKVFRPVLRHLADRVATSDSGEVSSWPDGHSPCSIRRSPFDHALHNARCADFSDREPCRNRRGACSHGARGSSSRGDHLAPRDIRLTPRETLGRAAGTSAWASRRKAPARY